MIAEYTKTADLMRIKQYDQKGDKVNMCGAIVKLVQYGRMEGLNQGMEQGIERGVKALIETCIELGSTQAATQERLMAKLQLSRDSAEKYIEQYWH